MGLVWIEQSEDSQLISTIRVLFTLTISSFALEAREECTGHENARFYRSGERVIEELLNVRLRISLHAAFGLFSLLDDFKGVRAQIFPRTDFFFLTCHAESLLYFCQKGK